MILNDLLNYTGKFKHRNEKIKDVVLVFLKPIQHENSIVYSSYNNNKKYYQFIEILGKNITKRSDVKIFCNCESFYYEFQYVVEELKSLFLNEKIKSTFFKKPLNKNPYMIASGCKHINRLARKIYYRR